MSLDPCLGVESQLQSYLDRQLTPDEVSMIEQHLGTCAYCREGYHFPAKLRHTVTTVCCRDPVPAHPVDRVLLHCRARGAARSGPRVPSGPGGRAGPPPASVAAPPPPGP